MCVAIGKLHSKQNTNFVVTTQSLCVWPLAAPMVVTELLCNAGVKTGAKSSVKSKPTTKSGWLRQAIAALMTVAATQSTKLQLARHVQRGNLKSERRDS